MANTLKLPVGIENFYHGLLLGLLRGSNPDWLIKSNRESGDGFSDILIKKEHSDTEHESKIDDEYNNF